MRLREEAVEACVCHVGDDLRRERLALRWVSGEDHVIVTPDLNIYDEKLE